MKYFITLILAVVGFSVMSAPLVQNLYTTTPAPGLPFLDKSAVAFIATNGITDPQAENDIYNSINELTGPNGNFRNNLVDAFFFQSRFNPTNNRSFFGSPLTVSNVVWTTRGAYMNQGLILSSNYTDLRNSTIVVVYAFPRNLAPVIGQGGTVAGAFDQGSGNGYALMDSEQQYKKVVAATGTTYFGDTGSTLQGLVNYPTPYSTFYTFDTSFLEGERQVSIISMTNGVVSEYEGWNESEIGTGAPVLGGVNTGLTQNTPLNSVYIGTWGFKTGAITYQNKFNGVVSAVFVFNTVAGTNLEIAATRAARWLEPETTERYFVGDSLMAFDQTLNKSTTNGLVYYLMQRYPNQYCWRNDSMSGRQYLQLDTPYFTNFYFLGGLISKVNDATLMFGDGINDIYSAGINGNQIFSHLTNLVYEAKNADPRWKTWVPTIQPILNDQMAFTGSGYNYNPTFESYRNNFNINVETNSYLFTSILRRDEWVNQFMLNTNNGYSLDGLHFHGPLSGNSIWQFMAGSFRGDGDNGSQPMSDFTGNLTSTSFTGNGSGLANVNGQSITAPLILQPGVTHSNFIDAGNAFPWKGANWQWIVSDSNNMSLAGAGTVNIAAQNITNSPYVAIYGGYPTNSPNSIDGFIGAFNSQSILNPNASPVIQQDQMVWLDLTTSPDLTKLGIFNSGGTVWWKSDDSTWTSNNISNGQLVYDWFTWSSPGPHDLQFIYESTGFNQGIAGIVYPVTNSLELANTPLVTGIVMGDSVANGAAGVAGLNKWVSQMQIPLIKKRINLVVSAEGGTGYQSGGSTGGTNFGWRLTNYISKLNPPPSFILWAGSINDNSNAVPPVSTAQLFIAATNCYNFVRTNMPNCKQYVMTAYPDNFEAAGQWYTSPTISNAAAVFGYPVLYPDYTTNASWLTASNAPTYISAGNNPHPNILGSVLYANNALPFLTTNVNVILNGSGGFTNAYGNNVLLAQSAAATVSTYTVPAATTNNYEVGGFVDVTAVTVDVAVMKVTFTDENNASQTVSMSGSITATGFNPVSTQTIRAKTGTISVLIVLTTNTGSIAYDAGAFIRVIQ